MKHLVKRHFLKIININLCLFMLMSTRHKKTQDKNKQNYEIILKT